MSDAEDNTKAGDRESKDAKDKTKEDGEHSDNDTPTKTEESKDDSGKNKDKMTPNKKNAKPKNQKKEESEDEAEEEEDDDDDDDDEENDTDGKVPLLDQPLQISGTRDRKKVQRFSDEFKAVVRESPKNEIPEGRGTQLGDIARIESQIQKVAADNLKPLYKVLFNRIGKPAVIKRHIRKFNGFDFKEGSDLYTKKRASITKLDMKSLKSVCRALDLVTSGTREELVNRVLDFLMEPKESRPAPKNKKTVNNSSKKTKRKGSSRKSKKKVDSDEENESSDEEMDVDEKESSEEEEKKLSSEEEAEEDEEDSEEDKKKKAPKKKSAANSKKPAPKKADQKKEGENKKAEAKAADNKKKRKEKQPEVKSDDESSEDEPLVKKTKQPPTDDEIKTYVKQILEGANLEEITMKTVCKQVYAAYPEFDLAHKKDFIKTTVKSLIST